MIRIAAAYPRSPGKRFDLGYYIHQHLPHVREAFGPYGLRKIEVDQGLEQPGGGESPFFAIGYLYFDDLEAFRTCYAKAGAQVVSEFSKYTDVVPLIQVGEYLPQ